MYIAIGLVIAFNIFVMVFIYGAGKQNKHYDEQINRKMRK